MEVGELVHVIADAHIYDRHVPIIKELISRTPYPAPKFWLNPEIKFLSVHKKRRARRRLCDRGSRSMTSRSQFDDKRRIRMNLIVAVDKNWAIGNKGEPLVIPADHKMFDRETTGKAVVLREKDDGYISGRTAAQKPG